jgi:hypothetical protein
MIETDYLVIGAGLSGLAFADELIRRTDAHVTIVDKRDAPGGHWNDAYPFVRLHQPSSFYGVESIPLRDERIDTDGYNKGYARLADAPEITAYCHAVMRDGLLASGRVSYLPMSSYETGDRVRQLLSGKVQQIRIRRKLVDASYYTNSIPLTHTRTFTTGPGVTCIVPNDLPRVAHEFDYYAVIGAGKTATDTCLWLLSRGVVPERIRWVVSRDQWFVNRAKIQPAPKFLTEVFEGIAQAREDIALATSARDLARRHEEAGFWLRVDKNVEPTVFRAAFMSEGEIDALSSIRDVIRMGKVRHLADEQLDMSSRSVSASPGTLYIDCSASAVCQKPGSPIFQDGRIVIQAVRFPQIPFSSALIAFIEAQFDTDDEKNALAAPVPVPISVDDYIRGMKVDLENRLRQAKSQPVRDWIRNSRLDGFSKLVSGIDPNDLEKVALLERIKSSTVAAYGNIPSLLKTLPA